MNESRRLAVIDGVQARPCIGCGYCCLTAQCSLSFLTFGRQPTCPALEWDGSRHWCALAANECAAEMLAVGYGCSSDLNSWRTEPLCDRRSR